MPTVEFIDRTAAIKYIKEKGYVSYSSLCLYKNGDEPTPSNAAYFTFGTELHSRFLEKKKIEKLDKEQEKQLKLMIKSLEASPIVTKLMKNVKVEQLFKEKILGVNTLGRIDVLGKTYCGDLKTTRLNSMPAFVNSLNFLQPALYLRATGLKDFYYIGISKQAPYKVMVFNVREKPKELQAAQNELTLLLKQLKKDLK
jgi:hypothetical protein